MYAVRNIRVQLIVHFFMNGTQHRGNEKETLKDVRFGWYITLLDWQLLLEL